MPPVKRLRKHTIVVWSNKDWFVGKPLKGGKHDAPIVRLLQEALDDGDALITGVRSQGVSAGRAPEDVREHLLKKPGVHDGG
jgi:hypothetical protein